MYDILQLNDMLVPELHDIAEQLAIPNYKKLDKQDLVNKILGKQANDITKPSVEEKTKRKRIAKPTEAEAEPVKEKPKAESKPEPRLAKRW